MYSFLPNVILGFHGCDRKVAEKVLAGQEELIASKNNYDWLGHGIYFWENNPVRAMEYAMEIKGRTTSNIKDPAVIGAIIYPGKCLNLTEAKSLSILKDGYNVLHGVSKKAGFPMPENKKASGSKDLLLRYLDCAVIEIVHYINKYEKEKEYDTVRGVFTEGEQIYPNSGINEKTHIQVCVRNAECIKGYFRVIDK